MVECVSTNAASCRGRPRNVEGDESIALTSLDPAFTAEFANVKFLAPVPEDLQAQFADGVLEGAVKAATFDDKLIAVPSWSNTQVLWYRKSVAEKAGLDSPAGRDAAAVIKHLVDSGAANPALSNADETLTMAGFAADNGGFMVNWEYV